LRRLTSRQCRAGYAGVGADRQCFIVGCRATGERHEAPSPIRFWEWLGTPGRFAPLVARHDPDLEDFGGLWLTVVFGVLDAAAGAHHLHVARFGTPSVTEAVLVGNGALPHIGNDFHIGVWVRRKAALRRDLVVVPNAHTAPMHPLRIMVIRER